jgi:hypothetical protein
MASTETQSTANLPFGTVSELAEKLLVDRDGRIGGCRIRPQSTFRGETRVWFVQDENSGARWFVKRFDEPRILSRYVEGMRLIEELAVPGSGVVPMRVAGTDAVRGILVTDAVPGGVASDVLIAGSRYDRLPAWPTVDLQQLADRVARSLGAIWKSTGSSHEDLADHTAKATADRILRKLARLQRAAAPLWQTVRTRIEDVCARLKHNEHSRSLMIGDVDLANMILVGDAVCFVDLDDVGVGDRQRDLACLLHRLEFARRNWKYAGHRINRVERQILQMIDFAPDWPILACYQVELQLDAIWSAIQFTSYKSLPVHGRSARSLEVKLLSLLDVANS